MPIHIHIEALNGIDARRQILDLIYGDAPAEGDLNDVIANVAPTSTPVFDAPLTPTGEAAKRTRRKKEDAPTGVTLGVEQLGDLIQKIAPTNGAPLTPFGEAVERTRRKKEDAPAGGENPPVATAETPEESSVSADGTAGDATTLADDAKVFTKAEVKSRLTDLTLKIGAAPAITFMHTVTGIPKFNDVPDTLYPKLMAALEKKLAE